LPVKDALHTLVLRAIEALRVDGTLPDGDPPSFVIERTKNRDHGDFATNAALLLAKPAARKPRDLAAALVAALPADPMLAKVEVAGPGFINFFLSPAASHAEVRRVLAQGADYGRGNAGG